MSEFVSSLWLLSSQGLSAKHQEKYNIIQSLAKNAEMPLGEHTDASFLPHPIQSLSHSIHTTAEEDGPRDPACPSVS